MTTFDELAQRYINTWNETDPNARDAWSSSPQRHTRLPTAWSRCGHSGPPSKPNPLRERCRSAGAHPFERPARPARSNAR